MFEFKLLNLVLSYDPVAALRALVYVVVLLSTLYKYKLGVSGSVVVSIVNIDLEVNNDGGFLTDSLTASDGEGVSVVLLVAVTIVYKVASADYLSTGLDVLDASNGKLNSLYVITSVTSDVSGRNVVNLIALKVCDSVNNDLILACLAVCVAVSIKHNLDNNASLVVSVCSLTGIKASRSYSYSVGVISLVKSGKNLGLRNGQRTVLSKCTNCAKSHCLTSGVSVGSRNYSPFAPSVTGSLSLNASKNAVKVKEIVGVAVETLVYINGILHAGRLAGLLLSLVPAVLKVELVTRSGNDVVYISELGSVKLNATAVLTYGIVDLVCGAGALNLCGNNHLPRAVSNSLFAVLNEVVNVGSDLEVSGAIDVLLCIEDVEVILVGSYAVAGLYHVESGVAERSKRSLNGCAARAGDSNYTSLISGRKLSNNALGECVVVILELCPAALFANEKSNASLIGGVGIELVGIPGMLVAYVSVLTVLTVNTVLAILAYYLTNGLNSTVGVSNNELTFSIDLNANDTNTVSTILTIGTVSTVGTSRTSRTCRTGFTSRTLSTGFALFALDTLDTLRTGCTCLALTSNENRNKHEAHY